MRSLFSKFLLLAALGAATWFIVLWRWYAMQRVVSVEDVALYLLALPLGLVAFVLAMRWTVLRGAASAQATASPKPAAPRLQVLVHWPAAWSAAESGAAQAWLKAQLQALATGTQPSRPWALRSVADGGVALLRETLTRRVLTTLVQASAHGPWRADAAACPQPVGLAPGEALIADGWPAVHRLLAEHFNFPAKFDFIDLPLTAAARCAQGSTLAPHFALAGLRTDGEEARLLESAGARHFRPGCVPVINLFGANAQAELVKHQRATYTVRATPGPALHEAHAIGRVRYQPKGAGADELRPVEACMAGRCGPSLVRGTEIRLSVHEACFAGRGLQLFAQVLSPWFALHAHTNSFTQLQVVSAAGGELLVSCPRCRGEVPLV